MTEGSGRPGRRLFLTWVVLAVVCTAWMWAAPGQEVVPFHVVWIGFALAYGLEAWALRPTCLALAAVTLTTGAILAYRAATGTIAWEETTEIPLMLLLAGLVVWHVQRREAALTTVTVLADRAAASAAQRERLARLTSHEMRTPLTIASGYVELILAREVDEELREELEVVHDELGRLARASDRMLRTIKLGEPLERSAVNLDVLLQETAHRWSAVASRDWLVTSRGGTVRASVERVRACLDTLIENAIRYTVDGDKVLLHSSRTTDELWLAVADSGPGFDPELAAAVNAGRPHAALLARRDVVDGPSSQTGLGIALVQEIMRTRAGQVVVGRSHLGGALVVLTMPIDPPESGVLVGPDLGSTDVPPLSTRDEAGTWAELSPDPPPTAEGLLRAPTPEA